MSFNTFRPSVWNDLEPDYAPGLAWSKGTYPRWQAPRKYLIAGYKVHSRKLDGIKGDGQDLARAAKCRELTRDMLRWYDENCIDKPHPDSFGHLIARYKTDEDSTIHGIKGNTRQGYDALLALWDKVIGHMQVSDLDYSEIKKIERAMLAKGRSPGNIGRHMNMLRTVVKYGTLIKMPGARDVKETLSNMRFSGSQTRSVAPTRDQILAIVAEADKRGLYGFSCGLLICYEYTLRAVDVRGQWLKDEGGEGGIVRNGLRWQDGLTWDMIEPDLSSFTKTISKTRKTMSTPYTFDLTAIPDLQARLERIGSRGRVGPVIVSAEGAPYTIYGWSQAFRRIRKHVGLPDELTAMDTRAGGVTEAKLLGANPYELRDAAQHRHLTTTSGYDRDRSASANNVVRLRQGQ
jgi:hypothetical protein